MNKEEVNTVTIPLDTYMDLIQRASVNTMLMENVNMVCNRINDLEMRFGELYEMVRVRGK